MSRALLLGLPLLVACMEAPKEKRASSSAVAEPAGAAEPALPPPKPVVARPAPRPRAPLELDEPELDPTLVPVEEDFRQEAERRIDKRSDLELELSRVAREVAKRK